MSNEISEDFKNLVADKKQESQGSGSESEYESSIKQEEIKPNNVDQQKQVMNQQYSMQQQMKQQEMFQKQMAQPVQSKPVNQVVEKKESVTEQKSIVKIISKLGVILSLFFVLGSSQVEGLVNFIPYLSTIPFSEYINLFLRSLLFVIIYFLLDTFVLH